MVLIDNSQYDRELLNHPKRDRSLSPDTDNKRSRAYITSENHDISQFYRAFSSALHNHPKRVHQDDLPPPPNQWDDMLQHPYKDEFLQAADVEFRKLEQMNA